MMNAFSKDDYLFWGLRLSLAWTFLYLLLPNAWTWTTAPMPHGLMRFLLPNSPIPGYSILFTLSSLIVLSQYIQKNAPLWSFWGICLLTLWAVCMEESNGIHNRNALMSWLFLAQTFAATNNSCSKTALQYSAQVVAGTYLLSALSKLHDAGLSWPSQGHRISLQLAKSFHQAWAEHLDSSILQTSQIQLDLANQYQGIVPVILGGALLLEFCTPLALVNHKLMLILGLCLIAMHAGINLTMNIFLAPIALPMVWVFINPLGWLLSLKRQT